ncbi:MAG: hypothetical protein ACOZAL_02820 [Patescibacteria group bacterium]
MKICVGSGAYFIKPRTVVVTDKGTVEVDMPNEQSNFVSVEELGEGECFREIKALYTCPGEPSFRIFLKDKREIWIRIYEKEVVVLCYPAGGGVPLHEKISF